MYHQAFLITHKDGIMEEKNERGRWGEGMWGERREGRRWNDLFDIKSVWVICAVSALSLNITIFDYLHSVSHLWGNYNSTNKHKRLYYYKTKHLPTHTLKPIYFNL